MISRPITNYEIQNIKGNVFVQLGYLFADQVHKEDAIKKLLAAGIGLRTAYSNGMIKNVTSKPPVYEIPKMRSLEAAANYVSENLSPNLHDRMACLAYNDEMVIYNTNHICGDGGYLIELNNIVNGVPLQKDDQLPIPMPVEYAFLPEYLNASGTPTNEQTPIKTMNWNSNLEYMRARHLPFDIPFDQLSCFDKQKKKAINITNSLWCSVIMSASAFNGKFEKFGIQTCVNLRPYMSTPPTLGFANIFSKVIACIKSNGDNETIQSIMSRFRDEFNNRFEKKDWLINIKNFNIDTPHQSYLGCELSNVGILNISPHIKDIHVGLTMLSKYCSSEVCLLAYTVDNNKSKVLKCRVRSPRNRVTSLESRKLTKSMEYFLRKIPMTAKVGEVVKELRSVQDSVV